MSLTPISLKNVKKDRLLNALARLNDKLTIPAAITEINKIVADLEDGQLASFVSILLSNPADQKSFARKEICKLVGALTLPKLHISRAALDPQQLAKLLGYLKNRLRESDAKVRTEAAHSVGVIAASLQAPKHASLLTPEATAMLYKLLADALHESRKDAQLGMCEAAVNAAPHMMSLPITFAKALVKQLTNPAWQARPQLLHALAHSEGSEVHGLLTVCPATWQPLLPQLLGTATSGGVLQQLAAEDWTARRAAAECLKCLMLIYGPLLVNNEYRSSNVLRLTEAGLEKCRYDKIKQVREVVVDALMLHNLLTTFIADEQPALQWPAWARQQLQLQAERRANSIDASQRRHPSTESGRTDSQPSTPSRRGPWRMSSTVLRPHCSRLSTPSPLDCTSPCASPRHAAHLAASDLSRPQLQTAATKSCDTPMRGSRDTAAAEPQAQHAMACSSASLSDPGGTPATGLDVSASAALRAARKRGDNRSSQMRVFASQETVRVAGSMEGLEEAGMGSYLSSGSASLAHEQQASDAGASDNTPIEAASSHERPPLQHLQLTLQPGCQRRSQSFLQSLPRHQRVISADAAAEPQTAIPTVHVVSRSADPVAPAMQLAAARLPHPARTAADASAISAAGIAITARSGERLAATSARRLSSSKRMDGGIKEVLARCDNLEQYSREHMTALHMFQETTTSEIQNLKQNMDSLKVMLEALTSSQHEVLKAVKDWRPAATGPPAMPPALVTRLRNSSFGSRTLHQPAGQNPAVPALNLSLVHNAPDMMAPASPTAFPGANPPPMPLPHATTTPGSMLRPFSAPTTLLDQYTEHLTEAGNPQPGAAPVQAAQQAAAAASAPCTARDAYGGEVGVEGTPAVGTPHSVCSYGGGIATPLPAEVDFLYATALRAADHVHIVRLMVKTGPCWTLLQPHTACMLAEELCSLLQQRTALPRLVPWLTALSEAAKATLQALIDQQLDKSLQQALQGIPQVAENCWAAIESAFATAAACRVVAQHPVASSAQQDMAHTHSRSPSCCSSVDAVSAVASPLQASTPSATHGPAVTPTQGSLASMQLQLRLLQSNLAQLPARSSPQSSNRVTPR